MNKTARTWTRALAWFAISAQPLFVCAWLIAGALEPGYSHLADHVSELGAETAAQPWIVNAGLALTGLSGLALAVALARTLPRRPAGRVVVAGLVLFGAALILAAALQLDCGATEVCRDNRDAGVLTAEDVAHGWLALIAQVSILATPFAVARALSDRPTAAASLACGLFGLGVFVAITSTYLVADGNVGEIGGLVQRFGLALVQSWLVILSIGVLYETRSPRALPPPTPLRPREFFGASWTGTGEIHLLPAFVWRRFGQRFGLRRKATWLSDDAWVIDDEAHLETGRIERRQRVCRLEQPDLIRVTADDLPEGAEVHLSDEGYRIPAYRALARIGPLLLPVRCDDVHRVAADRTLVDEIVVRFLGMPVARIEVHARLGDGDAAGEELFAARA